MVIVTDIDWDLGEMEGMPSDYGLPDLVKIEGLDTREPNDLLIDEICDYLEGSYGFLVRDFSMQVLN